MIPKQLHFRDPNPHLDWDRLPVRVVSEATGWPRRPDRPARAGVSAFGISGTNAHVVVEGYGAPIGASPEPEGAPRPVAVSLSEVAPGLPQADDGLVARGTRLLPLSGKSDEALRALAGRYLAWLDERGSVLSCEGEACDPVFSDMAWTAGVGRSHFDHRAAVVFGDAESLRDSLRARAEADGRPGAPETAARVAFAYPDGGTGWVGMGEALYGSEPVVRAVLDRCDEVLGEARGASLLDVMFGRSAPAGDLDDPRWKRPAVYALECALTALWSSVGVRPSVALGRGLGELAAAQAAGVFGLDDGLRLAATLDDEGAVPEGVAMGPPSLTLVSGASGREVAPDAARDAAYWRRQAAGSPAAFEGCIGTLAALGVDAVVEIGPDAALGTAVAAAWREMAGNTARPVVLSSLQRPSDGEEAPAAGSGGGFVQAVAGAWEAGLAVSFAGLFAGETRRRISLPDYPFERRRHWMRRACALASEPGAGATERDGSGASGSVD